MQKMLIRRFGRLAFALLLMALAWSYMRHRFRWEDVFAACLAAALILRGLVVALAPVIRPKAEPVGFPNARAGVMALSGLLMLAPIVAPFFLPAPVAYGLIVALLALLTLGHIQLMRRSDEMLRRISGEVVLIVSCFLLAALFVYAAGERMGVVSGLTAWGMMDVVVAAYFFAMFWIEVRYALPGVEARA